MWSCDQRLAILAFLWEKLSWFQFYKDLTGKNAFWGVVLVQVLGTNLKFCTSIEKGLKVKFIKFWELIPTFAEVAEEKLVGGPFLTLLPPPSPPPHPFWIEFIRETFSEECEIQNKKLLNLISGNFEIITKEIKSIETEMSDLKKSIEFTEYVLQEKFKIARKNQNTLMNKLVKYMNVSLILNMFIRNQ